ncbi:MAG: glycosyl hydrolase, partial [Myxococcota bacterium]
MPLLAAGVLALVALLCSAAAFAIDPGGWNAPPREARPAVRWWWPGGAVDEAGIRAELRRIHAAGFGAVELQPLLLGLSAADLAADPRVRSVGDATFVRHVATAAREAAALGLAFDLTLGSGWPGGLPEHPGAAERQLLIATRELTGPEEVELPIPPPEPPAYVADVQRFLDTMGPFDPEARLVAVLAVRVVADGSPLVFDRVEDLTDRVRDGRVAWQVPAGRWRLLAFHENRTGHSVLGGAYPGGVHDALTVDHLHERGARALWSGYVAPLLAALPKGSVRSLFIDSFELVGELPWTRGFREAFRERKGYDLTPHLPLLFRRGGESKYSDMVDVFGRNGGPIYLGPGGAEQRERVREDYVAVRQALFLERFLGSFLRLGREHGLAIRLQAHGGFADYLDAYALADVPEAEGLFAGGSTDFLKLASSAAHVAGRPIASSESFITLRFWGHQLEVPELDLLAGRAFSAGINQLVYHGLPYPYSRSDGRPWYPFSGGFGRILAGPLPMTTWLRGELWDELPRLNLRLARLGFALQQGEPAADVAWLRAEGEFPDAPSFEFGRVDPHEGESPGALALGGRGLVYDRVSR